MTAIAAARALLFDMDGTLVTSEPLKGRALAAACGSYGAAVEAALYAAVMGQSWAAVTRHFFQAGGIDPDPAAFNARFRAAYLDLLDTELAATAGAVALLHWSAARGVRSGLVSSAARWTVDRILSKLDVPPFATIVSQEDVTRHKPDPEPYRLSLERLGLMPDQVVVFEDSESGVQAAVAAGCPCVAIRHGLNAGHDFTGAVAILDSFESLLQR